LLTAKSAAGKLYDDALENTAVTLGLHDLKQQQI
jgi:hypothetical protein